MTSVARRREPDDSGDYSEGSQDIEQNHSGNEVDHPESDFDSQASESDHSEGDPDKESQETERRVDDDEDRSNPQYIPKRGTFYEHDDRTAASGEELANTASDTASEKKEGSEAPSERRRPPRKSDVLNKWSHDKFNENEQAPKSRDELVSIYGYDIRNEDAPPHARRNRRYGRGPNKYTRTWEDEEAYRRQTAAQAPRKPPNAEDFPDLEAAQRQKQRKPRMTRPRSKSQPASNESLNTENGANLQRNSSIKATAKPRLVVKPAGRTVAVKTSPKPAAKEKESLPAIENLTITANVSGGSNNPAQAQQRKVNVTVAQQRPVPTDQAKKKPVGVSQPQQTNSIPNKAPLQQAPQTQQSHPENSQAPSGTEGRGGSKRYSSLRQRPLSEPYTPHSPAPAPSLSTPGPLTAPVNSAAQAMPVNAQQRYHSEYPANAQPPAQHQGSPGPQIHPQLIHQVVRSAQSSAPHGPSPPHPALPPAAHPPQQVRIGMMDQQQLVPHPHHQMPQHMGPQVPQHMAQLPPAQGYAPPAMMPAQYMQQSGNNAVFSGGPIYAPPPAPYPPHMYPHHNFATQAGGMTYYNVSEREQPPQRAARRPTAAIPIVRPGGPDRPANSSEKDNIDRIVENMFVRRPWPLNGRDDVQKEKDKSQESRSSQEPQTKESQSDSLTSSSTSTESKPSESKEEKVEEKAEEKAEEKPEEKREEPAPVEEKVEEQQETAPNPESISTDA